MLENIKEGELWKSNSEVKVAMRREDESSEEIEERMKGSGWVQWKLNV